MLLQCKFQLESTKGLEEMSKTDFQDGGCGGQIFNQLSFNDFVSTRRPGASHQVSTELDHSLLRR